MSKALILTVGRGEGIESSIHKSLIQHNPEIVVFVVTESSTSTLERSINNKKIRELYPSRLHLLEDEDDLSHVYFEMKKVIQALLKEGYHTSDMYVDFTTGTKVMSAAAASLSLLYGLASLTYVSGKRNHQGRVISGSERVLSIEPLAILLDIELEKVPELMQIYQYSAALRIITNAKQHSELFDDEDRKRLEALEHLIKGMHYWDLFNHESAVQELKQSGLAIDKHIHCLESLKRERITYAKTIPELKGNVPTPRLIVDILANAERRAREGNYDDAVARLYRTIEMVAHFWLINKYKLNLSDIDPEKLKAINRDVAERYRIKKESEGKIQTALLESYALLHELEPESEVVKTYLSQEDKLKAYLNFRNSSILAHGCEPLDSEKYNKLKELAFILANSCVTNLESEVLYVMNLFRNIILGRLD